MAKRKRPAKDGPKKKKYSKPNVTRHGSLAGLSDRIVGTTSCCLTQRMRRSLALAAVVGL
jgi:hypothetical protein